MKYLAPLLVVGVFVSTVQACHTPCPRYILSPLSDGLDHRTVFPGETFDLDFILSSADPDVAHQKCVFDVLFEQPGLEYLSYSWQWPYVTGSASDDSEPALADLPVVIDADTLSGPGHDPSDIDVRLANRTKDYELFTTGHLVTMTLKVPDDYAFRGSMLITAVPITFLRKYYCHCWKEICTEGEDFELTVIPEPATVVLLAAGGAVVAARRRRTR